MAAISGMTAVGFDGVTVAVLSDGEEFLIIDQEGVEFSLTSDEMTALAKCLLALAGFGVNIGIPL